MGPDLVSNQGPLLALCVLNEEHHQEGDDRCGSVDDQLPSVVVMEVRHCLGSECQRNS
jgi:hypothetical protein